MSSLRHGCLKFPLSFVLLLSGALSGCLGGDDKGTDTPARKPSSTECIATLPGEGGSSTGAASIFRVDPMISSGNSSISPTNRSLDDYVSQITLENLSGRGVLHGTYADVRNGTVCGGSWYATSPTNQFHYKRADSRFQEAMTYYYADRFRSRLDEASSLLPQGSFEVIASCLNMDNAFYQRWLNPDGSLGEYVCLGNSVSTPGASYAEDATVVVHELQHGTTAHAYSPTQDFNRLNYDEAGGLNEAISDFMALSLLSPMTPASAVSSLDPRVFSRWALGLFDPYSRRARGSHKCPEYDSDYPLCRGYQSDASGFSSTQNTVSFVYPDGLGWPYSNNFRGPAYATDAWTRYTGQESIHNISIIATGALWDAFEAITSNHGGDADQAHVLIVKALVEGIKHLPRPTSTNISPITYRGFAQEVISAAASVGLNSADQASIRNAFTARGLYGGTPLDSTWGSVGPGSTQTPGLMVKDDPTELRRWVNQLGYPSSTIPQGIGTGANNQIDAGEIVAVWFDLQNIADGTAGGVLLNVELLDHTSSGQPSIEIMNDGFNWGNISSSRTQIRYGKVNGRAIASALASANPTFNISARNSYFGTNPNYSRTWNTAVWVRVPQTSWLKGHTFRFRVTATPSNGQATVVDFPVRINQ